MATIVGRLLESGPCCARTVGVTLLVVVCLLVGEWPAFAQKDSVVALGASFSLYRAQDEIIESPLAIGVVARIRRHSGLGGTIGLNWIKAPLVSEATGSEFGTLLVRPLMFGPVYTRQFSDFALSGSVVFGYSFNGLRKMSDDASYSVSDTFAWRPSLSVWVELGNHWGFLTSLSYFVSQPELTARTAEGTTRRTINLNAPFVTFGLAYGVF